MSAPVPVAATCRRHAARLLGLAAILLAILLAFFRPSGPVSERAASVSGGAYWLATAGGRILNFGGAAAFDAVPSASIVGVAGTPSGNGLWLVGRDGGVFSRGDAGFFGSLGALKLNQPIVGIAGTPSGQGYWLVGSDGGLFAFGDAGYYGSLGALPLNKPIVGLAATPSGLGYWMVASDGGMFAFGDAAFLGSMGGTPLNKPVVGMTAGPDGAGYWLVASDGGTFSFGNAGFHGSTGALKLVSPIVGIASTPAADGYWMVAEDGGVFAFDAPFLGSGTSRTGAATATVSGDVYVGMAVGNARPDARSGSVTTAEDTAVTIDVLSNDKYLTDTPLTVKIVTNPTHGTAVVKSNLTVTYTPDANYTGTDSFRYEVKDKDGDKDTAAANITVSAVNDSPKISNIADRVINEDGSTGSIAVTVTDVDNSDGGLTVTATSSNTALVSASGISFGGSGSNRTLTVTPAANANGSAVITVKVSDGSANTTDSFDLTVMSVNDIPVANDGSLSTNEDQASGGTLTGSDPVEASALTFSLVGANGGALHGTVAITNAATGAYTYTPAADYNGTDSLSFVANDGTDNSLAAQVTVTVDPVDDVPVATDDSAGSTNEDTAVVGINVLANDSGLGDGGLVITFSNEVGGTASLVGNLVTFTPTADFNGAASFDYTVTDGDTDADTAHVTVTVDPVDDVPVATDDSAGSTIVNIALVGINVLANDSGLGDGGLVITFSNEVGGTASLVGNLVTFTPTLNFTGSASFDYTVTDGDTDADTGTVTVNVLP
jgi:hypothetical protein